MILVLLLLYNISAAGAIETTSGMHKLTTPMDISRNTMEEDIISGIVEDAEIETYIDEGG